jgi:preprotein translocase subunit SecG
MQLLFAFLMFTTSVFLILLVLVQRGRGGGLAGAFGGMGGQSAFGTKAGDLFTRVTMIVATVWFLLCIAGIAVLNSNQSAFGTPSSSSAFDTAGESQTDDDVTPGLSGMGDSTSGSEATSSADSSSSEAEGGAAEPP